MISEIEIEGLKLDAVVKLDSNWMLLLSSVVPDLWIGLILAAFHFCETVFVDIDKLMALTSDSLSPSAPVALLDDVFVDRYVLAPLGNMGGIDTHWTICSILMK